MTFDPNAPFEVLSPAEGAPAGFDPSAPFEVVQPAAEGESFGQSLARAPGRAARMVVQGIPQVPDMLNNAGAAILNAPVVGYNAVTGSNVPEPFRYGVIADAARRVADAMGLPQYDNSAAGRVAGAIGEAVVGAGPAQVAGRVLAPMMRGAGQMIARAFGEGPAVDAIASGAGGAAQGVANEAGVGELGQTGAGLGGGLVGGVVASAIIAAVARRRGVSPEMVRLDPPRPEEIAGVEPEVAAAYRAQGFSDTDIRQALDAFRLADAQRQRMTAPDTVDTQPAGVRTEGGAPVAESARMGQDFVERSRSPRDPEMPRMPDEEVQQAPRQTYRFTEPDPNAEFPGAASGARPEGDAPMPGRGEMMGRTPFPDQAEIIPPSRPPAAPEGPRGPTIDGDPPGAPPASPEVQRIEQQIGRLTARGEPAEGTPAARQVERLRGQLQQIGGSAPPGRGVTQREVGREPGAGPVGGAAQEGGVPPRSTTDAPRALPAPDEISPAPRQAPENRGPEARQTGDEISSDPAAPSAARGVDSVDTTIAKADNTTAPSNRSGRMESTEQGAPSAPARAGWEDIRDFAAAVRRGEDADPAAAARELNTSPDLPLSFAQTARLRAFLEGEMPKAAVVRVQSALPRNASLRQWADTVRAETARKPQANEASRATAATRRAAAGGDAEAKRLIDAAAAARAARDRAQKDLAEARDFWKGDRTFRTAIGGLSISAQRQAGAQRDYAAAVQRVRDADAAVASYRPGTAAEPASPARSAGSSASDQRPGRPGEAAAGDAGSPPLYSTPLDPAAIRRFITDPALAGVRKLRDALLSSTTARQVGDTVRTFLASNRATMRAIAERHPGVKEIGELTDMLASDPGTGRGIRETYQTAADSNARSFANRLRNVLGQKPDAAADARIRDLLTGNGRPRDAAEAAKVQRTRALLDQFHDYLKKAGIETGYVRGRYFPRLYDAEKALANSEGFLRDAAQVYRKMGLGATEAREAAEHWLDRLAGVGRGGAEFGHSPASSRFTKGRELPADADTIMRNWLNTDPRAALDAYFVRGSKAAEFVRRFGKNGEKVEEMFTSMFRQGVSPGEVAVLRRAFASSTGTMASSASSPAHSITGWVQTLGPLAVLPRAVLSSLVEGAAIGTRTGNLWHGLEGFADSWREVARSAKGDTSEARRAAEIMGIVSDGLVDMRAAAVMDTALNTHLQQRLAAGLFRVTGMHELTNGQRVAATRIGQKWVAQLAEEVTTGASTSASAKRLLAELGVDEADARKLHAWLGRNGGTPRVDDLLGDSAEAGLYRGAIRRFVNESVQNPEAVDKPALAGHHVGRLAYGITSFMFAFTRNVLLRSMKSGAEGLTGEGYTIADRARLLGPVLGFMVLATAQFGVSKAREALFNPQQNRERDPWVSTILNLDRTGAFGTLSPIVNLISSAKYERDPSSLLTGPYLAHFATNVGKMTLGLVPQPMGPNSPRTNNAEHAAVRAFHASVLAPAISAAAALAPGGAAVQAAYGIGTVFGTSRGAGRALADQMVGQPTVRPRQPGASRNGLSSGGGIRAGGGIPAR